MIFVSVHGGRRRFTLGISTLGLLALCMLLTALA
jgi:hypothetical protein